MGGYVTNNGRVEMDRAQIILEGLAAGEDAIFQKRREGEFCLGFAQPAVVVNIGPIIAEERQNPAMKRQRAGMPPAPPTNTMQDHEVSLVQVNVPNVKPIHHSLPARPAFNVVPADTTAGSMPVVGQKGKLSLVETPTTDDRVVIKKANMSAADALRARLAGNVEPEITNEPDAVAKEMTTPAEDYKEEGEKTGDDSEPRGKKRKANDDRPAATSGLGGDADGNVTIDDADEDDNEEEAPPNPEADQPLPKKAKLKKNPDGTVDYEDTVK
jgi:5'-3' exoribonuclease 2